MIAPIADLEPDVSAAAFIAPNATVVGAVRVGADASVWFGVVIRGDIEPITIGDRTNIQDNSVLHVAEGKPLVIGSDVTVGHAAIVHACTVSDHALIGMGSCILDGAVIPRYCMVGAGALVPPGKEYPEYSLLVGSPARVVRKLKEGEVRVLDDRIGEYVANARLFASSLRGEQHSL